MTLRTRLGLLILLTLLFGFVLFGVLAYTLFISGQREQLVRLEALLLRDLERAQALVQQPTVGERLSESDDTLVQQFVLTSGRVLIPPGADALPLRETPMTLETAQGYSLVASTPWLSPSGATLGTIRSSLDVSDLFRDRRNLLRSLLLSGVLMVLTTAVVGLLLLRRSLQPLTYLARNASRIDPAQPSSLPYQGPDDEVAAVAQALNSSLANIRERQASERAALAEVAHELAAPLSLVAGHLDSLGQSSEDARLRSAKEAADELLYISQDLLTLSRGELESRLELSVVDFSEVVRQVARAYPGVTTDLLPEAKLAGSAQRLTQLVRNLVRNAVQASEPSVVRVVLREEKPNFVLQVSDEGAGIAVEDLPRIFERFYTKRGGVGVGLSVAKRIAEAHEGTISAASQPGQGSIFTVTLPSLDSQLSEDNSLN